MAFEIEIKARVNDCDTDSVCSLLKNMRDCRYLGRISKEDVYWHRPGDDFPLMRTRNENDNGTCRVLFTAKPDKNKSPSGLETNEELEFSASSDMWNRCIAFCEGTGLEVYAKKWKSGYHFSVMSGGFEVHAELLEVRFLGWFLEMEICPETIDNVDIQSAQRALENILSYCGINSDMIEARGYNSMLREIKRDKG